MTIEFDEADEDEIFEMTGMTLDQLTEAASVANDFEDRVAAVARFGGQFVDCPSCDTLSSIDIEGRSYNFKCEKCGYSIAGAFSREALT